MGNRRENEKRCAKSKRIWSLIAQLIAKHLSTYQSLALSGIHPRIGSGCSIPSNKPCLESISYVISSDCATAVDRRDRRFASSSLRPLSTIIRFCDCGCLPQPKLITEVVVIMLQRAYHEGCLFSLLEQA